MATVNFSVPEDVKNAFNETFRNRNKSAIIADLMREAVERERDNRGKSPRCSANFAQAPNGAGGQ